MAATRPLSLHARLLVGASFALFAFLGLTGLTLENAFRTSAVAQMRERLQSYVWAFLAGADVTVSGRLLAPEVPPEPRFDRPGSGLYASIQGGDQRWDSASAMGRDLPFPTNLMPGETRFEGPLESSAGPVYVLSQGVAFENPRGGEVLFSFSVAEHQSALKREVATYRSTLWAWLSGVALVLLGAQILVLRWSLWPLRHVSADLSAIERGEQEYLEGDYPQELTGLTNSLNDFIESEREHLKRNRNVLSDLAHSLKTPLAVVRTLFDNETDRVKLAQEVREQIGRMDAIVAYQLSRAATSGHQRFAAPITITEPAEEIVRSLEKVYAAKGVLCEFEIDEESRFFGERGDLMELLGNLLENAFKWARSRVLLVVTHSAPGARRSGLEITVEDDGPGIPPDRVEHLLQRGVRGDERVQGHGIGLSIVQDILAAYRGDLRVTRSETLGGASFSLRIPPLV